jgi:RNA polymerase sigma-70 factor (ECF subfamily)
LNDRLAFGYETLLSVSFAIAQQAHDDDAIEAPMDGSMEDIGAPIASPGPIGAGDSLVASRAGDSLVASGAPMGAGDSLVASPAPIGAGDSLGTRIGARDPDAIDEVYREHHASLRGFARRLIGDHAMAEDLVHDVFVVLPDAIRRFRGDASLRTFLCAIMFRRAHKFIRSAGRRRAALEKLANQPPARESGPRPDAALAQHELAELLYRALDRLPDDQRAAFILCEIEQLTAGEAGAIAGTPEATMRTRLFHARKKLRTLLEREAPSR